MPAYIIISLEVPSLALVNRGFAIIFATLKLTEFRHLCVLQVKGNATTHSKMGSLKRTIKQLEAIKVRQWCGEAAAC